MNKLFTPFVALVVATSLILAGCAGTQNVQTTLGPPAQVQQEVTALGSVAKAHIASSSVKAQVHQFATYLLQASSLDFTTVHSLVPKTGNMNADALIAAGLAYLEAAAGKWGAHNATTLAYAKAVGNGLIAAGF
jgi:hypothetical protein